MGHETIEYLERRSLERLSKLRGDMQQRLSPILAGTDRPRLSIYATGSLARLEANEASDLDAFFLLSENSDACPIGRINDVKVLNCVVEIAEDLGFPDFSNDGEFLKFIHIDEVILGI
jgi:predicted nucleotidyltransferase